MHQEEEKKDYALLFRRNDLRSLGKVRNMRSAVVIRQGDRLWLLVRNANSLTSGLLETLPAWKRYEIRDGLLFPPKMSVPEEKVPEGREIPLNDFLEITVPQANAPSGFKQKLTLSLIPSTEERAADALICDLSSFLHYCENTLAVRYQNLEYTVNEQRVFVIGNPLPPLPGTFYYLFGRVFLPCGWKPDVTVSSSILNSLLPEGFVIWERDKPPVSLPKFTKAGISSLRITTGGSR